MSDERVNARTNEQLLTIISNFADLVERLVVMLGKPGYLFLSNAGGDSHQNQSRVLAARYLRGQHNEG